MNPIDSLTEMFERFPGIGPRQARRFVQFLLSQNQAYRSTLAQTIRELGATTRQCVRCHRWFVKDNPAQQNQCRICSDSHRDQHTLFVVEKDADIENVEKSNYTGLYFVLGGTVPLAAEDPAKHIRVRDLMARIDAEASQARLKEVILGLSATSEGDHTRLLLQEMLRPVSEAFPLKISALGRGLSTGSELEYADPDTITSALQSRN